MNDVPREEDGRWKPGAVPNPEGKNGVKKGYQRYSTRLAYYDTHYTRGQLRDMSGDQKFLDSLSTFDAAAIQELAALSTDSCKKHRTREREHAVDRLDGKATQPIEHSGDLALKTTIII